MAEQHTDAKPGERLVALALALPVLVVIFGIARAEWFGARATRYLFEVEGYDPRDLLRGHYIQYRVSIENDAPETCDVAREACCVCFDPAPMELVRSAESMSCEAPRARCPHRLKRSYIDNPQRFYVPESEARRIEDTLRKAVQENGARVVFAVDVDGNAAPEQLLIDGISVLAR